MSKLVAKTRTPFRLPFVKGEAVTYVNPSEGTAWETRVLRAVNVKAATRTIRYYVLEGARGVLVPADRLLHSWESAR